MEPIRCWRHAFLKQRLREGGTRVAEPSIVVDKHSEHIAKQCPQCKFGIEEGQVIVLCPICKSPHHETCWYDSGGCGKLGCRGIAPERPSDAKHARTSPCRWRGRGCDGRREAPRSGGRSRIPSSPSSPLPRSPGCFGTQYASAGKFIVSLRGCTEMRTGQPLCSLEWMLHLQYGTPTIEQRKASTHWTARPSFPFHY